MKKKALIVFGLSLLFFLVTLINTFSDLHFWDFNSPLLKQIELFTFVFNHLLVVLSIVFSIKAGKEQKSHWYFLTMLLPVAWLLFGWYLFFVRIINGIFFG